MYNQLCDNLEETQSKITGMSVKLVEENTHGRYYECLYQDFVFHIAIQPLKNARVVIVFQSQVDSEEAEYWQTHYKFAYNSKDEFPSSLNHALGMLHLEPFKLTNAECVIYSSSFSNIGSWLRDLKSLLRMARFRKADLIAELPTREQSAW